MMPNLPCAIYTRKSSEEGLDQTFNSLDAQREACESYILSQKSEGWRAIKSTYDDGGFSGGNIERPALRNLLSDIQAGRIRIVVVYKVDRLTRSLSDFAKLIELFDANNVCFVSVTQQFSTTTSMGRLTLNVLLSFAQFEREVTGERIRDKIAASKKKGMWMGGKPSMGYIPSDRSLKIDEPQADRVRQIYKLYIETGSINELKKEVDRRGWLTPQRESRRNNKSGGCAFSRGHLRNILKNPIYRGQIVHKGVIYEGQHPAIVDETLWKMVQDQLSDLLKIHNTRGGAPSRNLLIGLLIDEEGRSFISQHTKVKTTHYRYYTCPTTPIACSLPAKDIEEVVIKALLELLGNENRIMEIIGNADADELNLHLSHAAIMAQHLSVGTNVEKIETLRIMLDYVKVYSDHIVLSVRKDLFAIGTVNINQSHATLIDVPVRLKSRRMATRLVVIPHGSDIARGPDPKLCSLISRAHDWLSRLTSGRYDGVQSIATEEKLTSSYVTRVIYVAYLAPDLALRIMKGDHPPELTAKKLLRMMPLPEHWETQRQLLRMQN